MRIAPVCDGEARVGVGCAGTNYRDVEAHATDDIGGSGGGEGEIVVVDGTPGDDHLVSRFGGEGRGRVQRQGQSRYTEARQFVGDRQGSGAVVNQDGVSRIDHGCDGARQGLFGRRVFGAAEVERVGGAAGFRRSRPAPDAP